MQQSFSYSLRRGAQAFGRNKPQITPILLISPLWVRIRDRTAVSVFVYRPDAEEIVIFRHPLHRVIRDVAYSFRVRPDRRRRIAPDDFVTAQVGFLVRVPT